MCATMVGMLVSFSMENFRAFRDEAVLDLRRPGRSPVAAVPWGGDAKDGPPLYSVAAIYGANASGKSALFRGVQWLQHLVCTSYRQGKVEAQPFRLDAESAGRPTHLSATFIADDGVCYAYGLAVLDGRVVEEWAERYTTPRPTLLFERDGERFTYGAALAGPKKAIENTVSESTLYLSAAAAGRFEALMPLYRWFADGLRCYDSGGHRTFYDTVFEELERDEGARRRVLGMLVESDFGLRDVQFRRRPLTEADKRLIEQHVERLAPQARTYADFGETAIPDDVVEARFVHETKSGVHPLEFDDESDGTKAMLCHAFVIDQAITWGRTVVFDEIDASLHPLLVASLIRIFRSRMSNPLQAQFIFTTHDVSLLEPTSPGGAAIGREDMWVTQKGPDGVASLTPVADFKPRRDENLRRRYLVGRFGGIPANSDYTHVGSAAGSDA